MRRDQQFLVLLNRSEKKQLTQLSRELGLTMSDVVRQLVRAKHKQIQEHTSPR
jgi:antitoxin component of RelBE/YafQ-DinJ toxin-antitoxin module